MLILFFYLFSRNVLKEFIFILVLIKVEIYFWITCDLERPYELTDVLKVPLVYLENLYLSSVFL